MRLLLALLTLTACGKWVETTVYPAPISKPVPAKVKVKVKVKQPDCKQQQQQRQQRQQQCEN